MAEFIIVFREDLEASLGVGIIYLLVEKTNKTAHCSKLWYGVFATILAGIEGVLWVIRDINTSGTY